LFIALAVLCASPLLAGCLSSKAPDSAAQERDRIAHMSFEEIGAMDYNVSDAHSHDIREEHTEVSRNVTVTDFSTFGADGNSLGEYTELDNEHGLIAMAVTTGCCGVDTRIVLLDEKALPKLKVLGTFDVAGAYGDVKIDETLPLVYVPYPGARFNGAAGANGYGFSIWDVSDPAHAKMVGQAPGGGCHMLNTIHIDGVPHVWCASVSGPTGYRIVAMPGGQYTAVPIDSAIPQSNPELLRYTSYYSSLTAAWPLLLLAPHDMTAQEDPITHKPVLVVADEINGLRVFDIANPETPVQLSAWRGENAESPIERVHTALLADLGGRRIAFGATETLFNVPPQLYIIDMTDYAHPKYLGTWIPPGEKTDGGLAYSLHNFQVVGHRLYIANFHGGMWVLDVSDPANPYPVALRVDVRDMHYPRPDENLAGYPLDCNQFWDPIVVDGYLLGTDISSGVEVMHVDGDPAGDVNYTSFA
jgi:hypothetical protein